MWTTLTLKHLGEAVAQHARLEHVREVESRDALQACSDASAACHPAYLLPRHRRDCTAGLGLSCCHYYLRVVLLFSMTTGRMEQLEDRPCRRRLRAARLLQVYCRPDGAVGRRAWIEADRTTTRPSGAGRRKQSDARDSELTCAVVQGEGTGRDSFICKRRR